MGKACHRLHSSTKRNGGTAFLLPPKLHRVAEEVSAEPLEMREPLLACCNVGWSKGGRWPELKRVIRVETLSRSAKALLPPHKCGASTLRD